MDKHGNHLLRPCLFQKYRRAKHFVLHETISSPCTTSMNCMQKVEEKMALIIFSGKLMKRDRILDISV